MAADVISLAQARLSPPVLDRLFSGEPALDILGYALKEYAPGRTAVVSSFGADSAVLLHLVAAVDPSTPVIFLETGKHFAETLAYRDELIDRLGLTDVRSVAPDPVRLAALDPGNDLHDRDTDSCCAVRKTEPLERALEGFDVWITGRKRHQALTRRTLPLFEREGRRAKVNPLAEWSAADVSDYREAHGLPAHPLVAAGFPSIGCWPCTSAVSAGEDARAGRWRGSDKIECGIHISHNGQFVRTVALSQAACG